MPSPGVHFQWGVARHGDAGAIVTRRHLRIAEIDVERATEAADLLRAHGDVDEVSHFGPTLRIAMRNGVDPEALSRLVLGEHGIAVHRTRPGRTTVEDAFVSMVRRDQAESALGSAA